jgi:hypothetical protein
MTRMKIVLNPLTLRSLLEVLAKDRKSGIRSKVAENPSQAP